MSFLFYTWQEPKFHTELVLYYIEESVAESSSSSSRQKLQELINASSRFNPEVVLSRLSHTKLLTEKALVYGKVRLCFFFTDYSSFVYDFNIDLARISGLAILKVDLRCSIYLYIYIFF